MRYSRTILYLIVMVLRENKRKKRKKEKIRENILLQCWESKRFPYITASCMHVCMPLQAYT